MFSFIPPQLIAGPISLETGSPLQSLFNSSVVGWFVAHLNLMESLFHLSPSVQYLSLSVLNGSSLFGWYMPVSSKTHLYEPIHLSF